MENKKYNVQPISSYNGQPIEEGSIKPFFFPAHNMSAVTSSSSSPIVIKGERIDYKKGISADFMLKKNDSAGAWEATPHGESSPRSQSNDASDNLTLKTAIDKAKGLWKDTVETVTQVENVTDKIKKGYKATTKLIRNSMMAVAVVGALWEFYDASTIAYQHKDQLLEFNAAPYAQEMKDRYSLAYDRFKEKNIYDICNDDGSTGLCLIAGGVAGSVAMKGYGLLIVGSGVATACYNSEEQCDMSNIIHGLEKASGYKLTNTKEKAFGGIEPVKDEEKDGVDLDHATRQRSTDEYLSEKDSSTVKTSKKTGNSAYPSI